MLPIPIPLPYHAAIVEHFRAAEPALWAWFASGRKREQVAEAARLDLLKSSYRLEPAAQPKMHELLAGVRDAMQLTCNVVLYQSQTGGEPNASLVYLPGEAHIVFAGPITSILAETELKALLAHELGHYQLYEISGGDYLVASDLLRALAVDPVVGAVASESLRLNSLWTEIFADRWACHITGDAAAAITCLLKVTTGLAEVSAESYLRQAEEIFTKENATTEQVTHPEPYIRARALKLWAERGDEAHADIERMIEGGLNLQRLDLLSQKRAATLTRHFLHALLAPAWFRTEAVLAHASRFFPDFATTPTTPTDDTLKAEVERGDASLADYLCYLMLDFATVDRDLGDVALAAAIVQSRRLGVEERFAEIAQKELALGKKAFAKIARSAAE